jgi:hypothetical protein
MLSPQARKRLLGLDAIRSFPQGTCSSGRAIPGFGVVTSRRSGPPQQWAATFDRRMTAYRDRWDQEPADYLSASSRNGPTWRCSTRRAAKRSLRPRRGQAAHRGRDGAAGRRQGKRHRQGGRARMTQPASQCGQRPQLGHVFGTATRTWPPLAALNRIPRQCGTTIPEPHVRRSSAIFAGLCGGCGI